MKGVIGGWGIGNWANCCEQIRLNEEVRCIRDSGEWKDCDKGYDVNDLVGDIKALYNDAITGE